MTGVLFDLALMGLINWIVTLIVVEGVVFDSLRDFLDDHLWFVGKYTELWHCHLCAGTWVGFALAVLVPGPIHLTGELGGVLSVLLNGFAYKALGHVTLEITGFVRATTARTRQQTAAIEDARDRDIVARGLQWVNQTSDRTLAS